MVSFSTPRPKVSIKLNQAGFRTLAKSREVGDVIDARAKRIADAAGEGFSVRTRRNRSRVVSAVFTETYAAMEAEAVDRALTRAIDAGR